MITTFRRFRRYVRPYWALLAGGSFLALLQIAFGLFEPWPLALIVDRVVADPTKQKPGGLLAWVRHAAGSQGTTLIVALVAAVVLVALSALANYWSTRLMESAGQRIGKDLRGNLFEHLEHLSLRFHSRETVGDLVARVTGDVDRVQDMMVNTLSVLVPNVLMVVGMAVIMLVTDSVFAIIVLVASLPLAYNIWRSTFAMKSATRRARKLDGRLATVATETLAALPVVQAFSLESLRAAEFDRVSSESLDANLAAVRLQARLEPLTDLSGVIARVVILGLGVDRVLNGSMSLGVLLVFLAYLAKLYSPIKALAKLTFNVSRGVACAERVETVLNTVPDVRDRAWPVPPQRLTGQLSFENVSFSYGREAVLRGVDLHVAAGERVAIVGPTGAGKSTLAALLPRFFDPTQGTVRADDIDIRQLALCDLRSQISMVLQDSVLFNSSITDNIALGRPGANASDIARAAQLALVDEFAGRLPDGMNTIVGERGTELSGGQRQRIAIARAILRDAPILVLDEPTSALDASSEDLVVKALANLMEGRTTFVIAHRLSTVRTADRIVVMIAGEIAEQGTHTQLLAADGIYARLFRLQQRGGSWDDPDGEVSAAPASPAHPVSAARPPPTIEPTHPHRARSPLTSVTKTRRGPPSTHQRPADDDYVDAV